jgi:hypothetical protein
MKVALLASKAPRAILEHTKDVTLGLTADSEGVMVENVLHDIETDLPVINTCIGAKVYNTSQEHRDLFNEQAGIVGGDVVSYLYALLSPTDCSDWMEMSVSGRFMAGDVGADVGFVQGTALPCHSTVYDAFPKLANLVDSLHILGYCGEVVVGVTADFQLADLSFGHCTGAFCLFTELAQQSPQESIEFCFGKRQSALLHPERIAACTMLSYPPYPYTDQTMFSVLAPRTAERHLFRFNVGCCELAYASASGSRIFEVRRRVRRTLDNCKQYNDTLQYRVDYGRSGKFVFCSDRYHELS